MALIVEDGTGKSDAESYISVADANTYDSKYVASATWDAATDPEKEVALRKGTQYLDARYNGNWRGRRANEDQALDWPRLDAVDNDGYEIDYQSLPTQLEQATVEAAIRSLSEELLPDPEEGGDIKKEKTKVGPITDEVEYLGAKTEMKDYPKVMDLLTALIFSGDRVIKG